MADLNSEDEAARQKKAAENPLVSYFSGQAKQPTAKPAQATVAPTPQPASAAPAKPATSTNVGNGAMQTAPAAAAPIAPQLQAQRAPQPTNFTNFERYFNANKDSSNRTSAALAGQTALKAAQARKALQDQQSKFQSEVSAGTLQGPEVGATNAPNDGTGGLVGQGTQQQLGGDLTAEQMLAKANTAYSGPGGLGDTAGTADTYAKNQAAQAALDATGSEGGIDALLQANNPQASAGAEKLSAGLVNAAGRKDFDALAAHFNPTGDLNKAVTQSAAEAKAAKDLSAKNAADWATQAGIKGTQEQQQAAYDQQKAKAAADKLDDAAKAADAVVPQKSYEETYAKGVGGTGDTEENRTAYMMSGVDPNNAAQVTARKAQIEEYKKAMHLTDQQQMDRTFEDFNSVMSPSVIVQNAAGTKDHTQLAAQKQFNPGGVASQTGSTTNNAIPWDRMGVDGFFVWRSMTPEDWQVLNSKPSNGPSGQRAWIGLRAQQLRAQQSAPKPTGYGHTSQ